MKRPQQIGSDRKQQGKQNRRFLRDTVINRFGGYIKIVYLGKQENERKRSPEGTQDGHNPPGRAWLPGALWCLVPTRVIFLVVSYFPNFCYIPKRIENIFSDFLESVYLLYHIPTLFHDSGVFQKVSLMCSSGVIVWVILLSTSMGILEI